MGNVQTLSTLHIHNNSEQTLNIAYANVQSYYLYKKTSKVVFLTKTWEWTLTYFWIDERDGTAWLHVIFIVISWEL